MAILLQISEDDQDQIGRESIARLTQSFSEVYPTIDGGADIRLVTNADIQKLNREHRSLDEPTDVLSFPTLDPVFPWMYPPQTLLGDVVISPEKAEKYGERLIDLVHHGLLHLLGFDHEQDRVQWDSEEEAIISQARKNSLTINPIGHDEIQLP